MQKKVEIIHQEEVFKKAVFRIVQATLRHERFDGQMSADMIRLSLERGDAVAAVLHDADADTLIFTEQFRYPAHAKGPGWLLELPAGMIDGEEDPTDALKREMMEELGYAMKTLHFIATFYLSPGGSSERIHLYYARVTPEDKTGEGGGLTSEIEDIRAVVVPVDTALDYIRRSGLYDAKTIIGLQWLALNRANLPGSNEDQTRSRRK